MKNKSNKHKLHFSGEFIKEVEFDKKEECHLLNATRFHLGKQLVGLVPFDGSFISYKGEIIRFFNDSSFQEDYFRLMTTPIPEKKKPEKKEKLIFEVEQTSFSVESNNWFINLKIPYGYSQMEHIKKGMKVILKKLKDK